LDCPAGPALRQTRPAGVVRPRDPIEERAATHRPLGLSSKRAVRRLHGVLRQQGCDITEASERIAKIPSSKVAFAVDRTVLCHQTMGSSIVLAVPHPIGVLEAPGVDTSPTPRSCEPRGRDRYPERLDRVRCFRCDTSPTLPTIGVGTAGQCSLVSFRGPDGSAYDQS